MNRFILSLLFLCFLGTSMIAQIDSLKPTIYPGVNENILANTKWRYTYTAHKESNTVIHKADDNYEYFLYLKYDNTFENFLNGKFTGGHWKLNDAKNELYYDHRQIDWWKIAEFTNKTLILEFSLNKNASYQYNFVRVGSEDAPFVRAANDLPDVDVEAFAAANKRTKERRSNKRRKKRVKERKQPRKIIELPQEEKLPVIKVEMVGGGFFGGNDPIYRNYIMINTNGRLIKEVQTEQRGLIKTKKTIERSTLEELARFIDSKEFFKFQTVYDCDNNICRKRLNQTPRPIPLRIAVTYGGKRKVVTVSIFGKEKSRVKYIGYPPELELIIEAINKLAD